MAENNQRFLWCERTMAELGEIKAEIDYAKKRMRKPDADQPVDWAERNRELDDWIARSHINVEKYAGELEGEWDQALCDVQNHWENLKTEIRQKLDSLPS